jgi:hypothetical protein
MKYVKLDYLLVINSYLKMSDSNENEYIYLNIFIYNLIRK